MFTNLSQRDSVLDTRADKKVLIGYSQQTKGYTVIVSTVPLKIVDTMYITLSENLDNNPSLLLRLTDRMDYHYLAHVPKTERDIFVLPTFLSPNGHSS